MVIPWEDIFKCLNKGITKGKEVLNYPLREPFSSFSKKIINSIIFDKQKGLKIKELSEKYNISENTIVYLIKKYK